MKKYFSLLLLLGFTPTGNAQSATPKGEPMAKTALVAKIKVFPNPATNVVNVLGVRNTSKADITIFDIYGNIVLAHQWTIRRNALNIPISELRPGAYIIKICSEQQQLQTKFYKR